MVNSDWIKKNYYALEYASGLDRIFKARAPQCSGHITHLGKILGIRYGEFKHCEWPNALVNWAIVGQAAALGI